jgi:hypothetical protein
MKKTLLLPLLSWSVITIIAFAISYWAGLNYYVVFAIVAGAVLVNGFVATLEDDLPGGFNNPDGSQTPRYARVTVIAARSILVVFVVACIIVLGLWALG